MRMRWAIVAVVVVVAATLALLIRPPLKQPALAHDLIGMQREVDFRSVTFAPGQAQLSLQDLPTNLQRRFEDQATQDQRHMDRLSVLLDRYGWPTKKMVGREGVQAALLLVDRAPDTDFKARAIALIERAGDDDTPQYAYLVDTVAVSRGEPQTYGTQWVCGDDNHVKLTTPVKDPSHLVALRLHVGLPPYDKFAREFCAPPPSGSDVRPVIKRRFGD